MVAVALVLGVFMLLMFLLIGGLIGYLARDLIYTQSTYPLHPEFFDDEGNIIPDEILAIRFENSYDEFYSDAEEED